ncbi:hypothetical protein ABTL90_19815, partial [Acinetobacter baumannii]
SNIRKAKVLTYAGTNLVFSFGDEGNVTISDGKTIVFGKWSLPGRHLEIKVGREPMRLFSLDLKTLSVKAVEELPE